MSLPQLCYNLPCSDEKWGKFLRKGFLSLLEMAKKIIMAHSLRRNDIGVVFLI